MIVADDAKTTDANPEKASQGDKINLWMQFYVTRKPLLFLAALIPIGLSLFHLYTASTGTLEPYKHRAIHLVLVLLIVFITENVARYYAKEQTRPLPLIDLVLVAMTLAVAVYIFIEYDGLITRITGATQYDVIFGAMLVLLILEAARRCVGKVIALLGLLFMLYAYFGKYVPGTFGHRGFTFDQIMEQMFVQTWGIFGVPLASASVFIIIFIIFGAFLMKSGAGEFFIEVAYALAGRARGGPAKTAVVASALMGTLSGSAVANVVTTGSFTIPLMIRTKLKPTFAAAVEASASTGGSIMPPVMSAVAFLIAQYTHTPYVKIIGYALVPAILFYVSVYFMIHFEACREGLAPMESTDMPDLKETMKKGGHFLIPIVVMVILLALQMSPMKAGFYAIVLTVALSWVRKETRMGLKEIIDALELGSRNVVIISVTCAIAGIIVGSISLCGLGIKFSSAMLGIAGGNLIMLLFLTMISCIILGMGMPIVPAYIIVFTLGVPAIVEAGVMPVIAHFFVFYYATFSGLTPPVALSAYAAAGIAKVDPLKVALEAMKVSVVAFIIPFAFVLDSRLMMIGGTAGGYAVIIITMIVAVVGLAASIRGWLLTQLSLWERLLVGGGALLVLFSTLSVTNWIGMGLLLFVGATQLWQQRKLSEVV